LLCQQANLFELVPYVGLPTSSVYYQKCLFQLCICAQIIWRAKISFSMHALVP
jgi:hypothetical protein